MDHAENDTGGKVSISSSTVSTSLPTGRMASLDAVKFAAVAGVILIHLKPKSPTLEWFCQWLLVWCVWYFLACSVFLLLRRTSSGRGRAVHWSRLICPYLAWSVLYWGLREIKGRWLAGNPAPSLAEALLMGSAGVQMYFLPMLMTAQVVAVGGSWLGERLGKLGRIGLVIGALILAWFWPPLPASLANLVGPWWGWLSLGLIYSAGAAIVVGYPNLYRSTYRWPLIILFLTVSVGAVASGFLNDWVHAVVGFLLLLVALSFGEWRANPRLTWLFSTSYGVFLAHHAWMEALELIGPHVGLPLATYTLVRGLAMGVVVLILSIGSVWLIRQSAIARYWLLGESSKPTRHDQATAQ